MKNLAYYGGVVTFASSLFLAVPLVWAASPPNIYTDIAWDEGDNNNDTFGSTVSDIMAAYNNARRQEESQLGLNTDALSNLQLPTQAVWDGMTDDAKALFLINAERTARDGSFNSVVGLPLAGIEQTVDTVAESYAKLLHDNDATGHFQPSGDHEIDNPFLRVNNAVGLRCREFLSRAENLAYFQANSSQPIGAASIPLPLERAIYGWMYEDSESNWGHREAVLLQDESLSEEPAPGFNNNYGSADHEGFLGIHVVGSTDYTPFGLSTTHPFSYGVSVVMNIYDPVHQSIALNPDNNCRYAVTLRTEDLPTVDDVNRAPVANDDVASTDFETAVVIPVLGNDSDPDLDEITYQLVEGEAAISTPENGVVVVQDDAGLLYTPNAGFSGTDSFAYTITDPEGETASATVTVVVRAAPNLPPVANDDTASTTEGSPVIIFVLNNDSDPEGAILDILTEQVRPYRPVISDPANGTAQLGEGQEILYTPDDGFVGVDTFTYTMIDDLKAQATATVTVTVAEAPPTGENQAPDAVDDSVTTRRNRTVLIDLLGNDTDADGDTLSIISGTNPANGRVMQLPNNQVVYRPNRRFTGSDSFTYTISDGNGGTDTATVTIDVQRRGDVNRPPRARADRIRTRIGQSQTIDLLANDSDREGDSFSLLGGTTPRNGTVVRNDDGTITYTPNEGFRGRDNFRYIIVDEHGGVAQGLVRVRVRR